MEYEETPLKQLKFKKRASSSPSVIESKLEEGSRPDNRHIFGTKQAPRTRCSSPKSKKRNNLIPEFKWKLNLREKYTTLFQKRELSGYESSYLICCHFNYSDFGNLLDKYQLGGYPILSYRMTNGTTGLDVYIFPETVDQILLQTVLSIEPEVNFWDWVVDPSGLPDELLEVTLINAKDHFGKTDSLENWQKEVWESFPFTVLKPNKQRIGPLRVAELARRTMVWIPKDITSKHPKDITWKDPVPPQSWFQNEVGALIASYYLKTWNEPIGIVIFSEIYQKPPDDCKKVWKYRDLNLEITFKDWWKVEQIVSYPKRKNFAPTENTTERR